MASLHAVIPPAPNPLSRFREAVWTLGERDICLRFPADITRADLVDVEEWLALVLKSMGRIALQNDPPPPADPVEAMAVAQTNWQASA